MVIYLAPLLPAGSNGLPETKRAAFCPAKGAGLRLLFGLSPGGVYPAPDVTTGTVVSYTAFSPLPAEAGGIFSVALSVALLPVRVMDHPALRSPDFPLPAARQRRVVSSDHLSYSKNVFSKSLVANRKSLKLSFIYYLRLAIGDLQFAISQFGGPSRT